MAQLDTALPRLPPTSEKQVRCLASCSISERVPALKWRVCIAVTSHIQVTCNVDAAVKTRTPVTANHDQASANDIEKGLPEPAAAEPSVEEAQDVAAEDAQQADALPESQSQVSRLQRELEAKNIHTPLIPLIDKIAGSKSECRGHPCCCNCI
ncbi:hypothetical protein WJX74_010390 [Apatococcus lobatus]|uniref:Uncharacterized protein n=1 Tax=Apatococcus lobatus TaxID=904363 RepID=A0AAW1QLM0_9CHLO